MDDPKGIGNRDEELIRGPETPYCCAHSPTCAVHQLPFDAVYVHCSCDEGTGRG
jgi:hypothetical protein